MKKIHQMAAMALVAGILAVSFAQADTTNETQGSGTAAVAAAKATPGTGKASKAGKVLKKSKKAKKEAAVTAKDTWICPMCHIKSDKPGKCPDCGMDMVKLPKDDKKK